MANTIALPDGLNERRSLLESELKKVVTELCFRGLRDDLNKLFEEYNVNPKPIVVSWDFYGEYDDEGGTTYYPNNIRVVSSSEEDIAIEEYVINKKSRWSDDYYDYNLDEAVNEAICEYREDLYDHDIEEITL